MNQKSRSAPELSNCSAHVLFPKLPAAIGKMIVKPLAKNSFGGTGAGAKLFLSTQGIDTRAAPAAA